MNWTAKMHGLFHNVPTKMPVGLCLYQLERPIVMVGGWKCVGSTCLYLYVVLKTDALGVKPKERVIKGISWISFKTWEQWWCTEKL